MHKDEYIQKYKVDKSNFYEVRENFPYIKDIKTPEAISDLSITYKLDLEKCEDFRINEDQLLEKLRLKKKCARQKERLKYRACRSEDLHRETTPEGRMYQLWTKFEKNMVLELKLLFLPLAK